MEQNDSFDEIENFALASSKAQTRLEHLKYELRGGTLDIDRYGVLKEVLPVQRRFLGHHKLSVVAIADGMRDAEERANFWLNERSLEELRVYPRHVSYRPFFWSQILLPVMNDIVVRESNAEGPRIRFFDRGRGRWLDIAPWQMFPGNFEREDEKGDMIGRSSLEGDRIRNWSLDGKTSAFFKVRENGELAVPDHMMKAIRIRLLDRVSRKQRGSIATENPDVVRKREDDVDAYLTGCTHKQIWLLHDEEKRLQAVDASQMSREAD